MNILLSNHIAEYVAALKDSGHHLFVPDNAQRQRLKENSYVHSVPIATLTDHVIAAQWLDEKKIDVVYAQGRRALVHFSKARKKCRLRRDIKLISTCHTGYVWGGAWKSLMFLSFAKYYGDGVVFLAEKIYSRYNWFCRLIRLKTWVIPNPVYLARFPQGLSRPLNGGGDLRLGYVSVISPNKGQRILVDAVSLLHEKGFLVSLALVGDVVSSSYLDMLNKKIAAFGLQSFVKIFPRLPYEEIPSFLATTDCYVCASRAEVAPFNILEAMASGLPVISTNVGGIADMVVDNQNGMLVEPSAEAFAVSISKAIEENKIISWGMKSRQFAVEKFANDVYARKMKLMLSDIRSR